MRGFGRGSGWLAGFVVVLAAAGGCSATSQHIDGTESMPSPASVWLTSDPASPTQPVKVEITAPGSEFHRMHTFEPGETLRGSFPVSEGRYRLVGLDGACMVELGLRPEHETDVVIRLDGSGGCEFALVTEHGYGAVIHDQPSVLVAPSG
jgi:hypothetical protein